MRMPPSYQTLLHTPLPKVTSVLNQPALFHRPSLFEHPALFKLTGLFSRDSIRDERRGHTRHPQGYFTSGFGHRRQDGHNVNSRHGEPKSHFGWRRYFRPFRGPCRGGIRSSRYTLASFRTSPFFRGKPLGNSDPVIAFPRPRSASGLVIWEFCNISGVLLHQTGLAIWQKNGGVLWLTPLCIFK